MFKEGLLDKILRSAKKLIPKSVFDFFAPTYHTILAYVGALVYGFPSGFPWQPAPPQTRPFSEWRSADKFGAGSMKVIGVTGTKGKSTTVFLISKILEEAELATSDVPRTSDVNRRGGVAAIGSLGFKIKDREWPNTLKMTMPGRFKLQKFLREAKKAGCKYVVLEVTSEGIKQKRHLGVKFDCAVFTNLHKEHIESHGSFENYYRAKQELFAVTKNIHILNFDDANLKLFSSFPAKHKIFYGLEAGDMRAVNIKTDSGGTSFEVYGTSFSTKLAGRFNVLNCLAALSVGAVCGIELPKMKPVLELVEFIPGRMEFIQREPFGVIVDYAHTPDSLEQVYKFLNSKLKVSETDSTYKPKNLQTNKLICVLGAAGGGRDKWKRPEFGRIAAEYCDSIILTNEDPYNENPDQILAEIESGINDFNRDSKGGFTRPRNFSETSPKDLRSPPKYEKILNRREAIKTALTSAQEGDTVVVTGKGSETSMAVAGGKKIPWSDKDVIREFLQHTKQGG